MTAAVLSPPIPRSFSSAMRRATLAVNQSESQLWSWQGHQATSHDLFGQAALITREPGIHALCEGHSKRSVTACLGDSVPPFANTFSTPNRTDYQGAFATALPGLLRGQDLGAFKGGCWIVSTCSEPVKGRGAASHDKCSARPMHSAASQNPVVAKPSA